MRWALLILVSGVSTACDTRDHAVFQGYAEGEYVRVAAPFAGNLQQLAAQRGSTVKAGDPLFTLEQENENAAKREVAERLRNAQAQLAQARANFKLSELTLHRRQELLSSHFVAQSAVDDARTAYQRDQAHVTELQAQVAATQASLAQADWKLAQKTVQSTVGGLVNDTHYVVGEWVPAGAAVVSLLPPENIKVRFYLPEPQLGALHTGQNVTLSCDGCATTLTAHISFISPQAEFTPPVIYNRENRAKFVYLVEARPAPADATKLHPGQPVDVRLVP